MKLHWLGGCNEVGRSSVLVEAEGKRLLLDHGVKLKPGPPEKPLKPSQVDAALLSHCHLDHSGNLPALYRSGFKGKIYSTATTLDLAQLLWKDSLKLAKLRGERLGWGRKELKQIIKNHRALSYGQELQIGKISVQILNAGHIPGSSSFLINAEGKNILYTGDINTRNTKLIPGAEPPKLKPDILITEATYAKKEHPPRNEQEQELLEEVMEALAGNAKALIPAFAVGRMQEVLLILSSKQIKPIWLDGMGIDASELILKYPELLNEPKKLQDAFSRAKIVKAPKQRDEAVKGSSAILTTSGMMDGGPVVEYMKRLHKDGRSKVIQVGYQVKGTAGRKLRETGRYRAESLDLNVKMFREYIDLSSHCGRSELFDYIKKLNPEKIFVIHSDKAQKFASELRQRGWDAFAPLNGEVTKL